MRNEKLRRYVVRAATYGAVGVSMYALNAQSALAAWGLFGDWGSSGQTVDCSSPETWTQTGVFLACSGHSYASGTQVVAMNTHDGVGDNATQAEGTQFWHGFGGDTVSVIAYGMPSDPNNDTSAATSAPWSIDSHHCRCNPSFIPF